MIAGSIFARGAIRALKISTGYDSKHVVDLDFQFPEGPKYSPYRKLALVTALRARVAALAGWTPSPALDRRRAISCIQ
jgi:hypothetical protein